MNKPTRPVPASRAVAQPARSKPSISQSKPGLISAVFFLVLLLVVLGGGAYYVTHSGKEERTAKKPTAPVVPEATPAPFVAVATPAPEPPPPVRVAPKPTGPSPEDIARVQARIDAVRAIEATRAQSARHDFAGARQALEAWLTANADQPQRTLVEHQIARLQAAERALPAMMAQPAVLVGAQIPAGNASVTISSVANGRLMYRAQAQFGVVERPMELSALGDAAIVPLLQRVDAAAKTALAPAYLLGLGKSTEAGAAVRDSTPNADALRADLTEFDAVAKDAALLAGLDAIDAQITRGEFVPAQEKLQKCLAAHPNHEFLAIVYAPKVDAWKAKIASAPTPAPVKEAPAPVVADSYPGVPAFNLSASVAIGDPDRQRLDAAAQWAAKTGNWDRHFKELRTSLINSANTGASMQHVQNIERLITLPTPALAVEQARFIHTVGTGALSSFGGAEESREFLKWLFAHPQILAAFNDSMHAQDKGEKALAQWRNIWQNDPASRETLANLAIACALVFDQPIRIKPEVFGKADNSESATRAEAGEVEPLARFRFYRDAAKQGMLKVALNEMTPWELMWVVDAPVPDSELLWAQKNAHFTRHDWGKAYGHIRYRMDRATQGVNPYTAYTLAQIEKEGGICGDQAYFAAMTAKANGIPAMVIGGEGDRGAHAWFGFEAGRNEWNLNSGRYADNYAAGTTRDPQTKRVVKEHELRQLTDPMHRTEAYQKSERFTAFALLLKDTDQRDLMKLANEAALRLAPGNYDAWVARLDGLAAAKAPTEEWLKESARMRTAFAKFSDIVQEIGKREADYLAANGDADAARKLVSRQTSRMETKDGERTDLILDGVFRAAELAEKSGDAEAVGKVYRKALQEKGEEVVAFRKISDRYYQWAKTAGKGPEVTRDLVSQFDRKHPEPRSDVFAIDAYKGVLEKLTGMAKEQSLEELQHRLERRVEQLTDKRDKLAKLQSKNADK